MRFDPSFAVEALTTARASARAAETPRRSSFAAALSGVEAKSPRVRAAGGTAGAGAATARASVATAGTRSSGAAGSEETRPVEGKPYVEIISGPRNGMFINRSGNGRDGEAFVLVKKDGRDVHIYGSGAERETVVMWHTADKRPTAGPDGVPAGEVSSRVEGKLYDEITAGPRNGMFINRSGNVRDGLAFVLVRNEHCEDHVYGSGKDQQVIRVWDQGYGPRAADDGADSGGASGGMQAPA